MRDGLLGDIERFAGEHAMLPPGTPVLAMVSGGADSVCMLHALRAIHDGRIGVLTVDHGLRAAAADEARFVATVAQALDCEAWIERVDVPPGSGVQERARAARRAAAATVAEREGFALIAVGHTASDQAETVLFRLARGTGRTGATGMAARSGRVVRPLLDVTRAEVREWCREHDVAYIDDPSNADRRFARVRVRETLVPALREIHPEAERAVGRFAGLLADEAEMIEPLVAAAWARCAIGDGLDVRLLATEGRGMRRLLVRRLLRDAGIAPDARWVAQALAIAVAGRGRFDAPGGTVAVDRGILAAEPPIAAEPDPAALAVPGTVRFGAVTVSARRGGATPPSATAVAVNVDDPLVVRALRPGDRLGLPGGGRRPVSRLLADAGVPARRRHLVPVVATASRVVWVSGYRAEPDLLAPIGASATVLELL